MNKRALFLIVIALIASSCSTRSDPPRTKEAPPAPVVTGSAILDFEAPKLGGGQVVGNEFANKDVAIWVWAPW